MTDASPQAVRRSAPGLVQRALREEIRSLQSREAVSLWLVELLERYGPVLAKHVVEQALPAYGASLRNQGVQSPVWALVRSLKANAGTECPLERVFKDRASTMLETCGVLEDPFLEVDEGNAPELPWQEALELLESPEAREAWVDFAEHCAELGRVHTRKTLERWLDYEEEVLVAAIEHSIQYGLAFLEMERANAGEFGTAEVTLDESSLRRWAEQNPELFERWLERVAENLHGREKRHPELARRSQETAADVREAIRALDDGDPASAVIAGFALSTTSLPASYVAANPECLARGTDRRRAVARQARQALEGVVA